VLELNLLLFIALLKKYYDREYVRNFIDNIILPKTYYFGKECYTAKMGMVSTIDTDGNVYIGTAEIGDNEMRIGNIYNNRFQDIWESKKHQKVIELMSSRYQQKVCKAKLCRHIVSHESVEKFLCGKIKPLDLKEILNDPLSHFI